MENIILVGHGSRKKEANNMELTGRILHNMMHPGCNNACVKVAYLQFVRPDMLDAIKECIKEGAQTIIIHPFFLSSGMHVTKDIPEIIKDVEKMYPDGKFIYTEPLGTHEKLAQIVMDRIYTAKGMTPQGIETRSFSIISEEMDFNDIPAEQIPIVKRVIHATADFEFKTSLMFKDGAIARGIEAIRSGNDILTDVEMVKTGINKKLLEKWGGKVICKIKDAEDKAKDRKNTTRAEIGIETALKEEHNIGIVAVGNAPTALLKTIELLNDHVVRGRSPLVIGVPVGFVKALESKALLATQTFPFITNMSRKGGTPAAVAIVNALLKMAEEA